VGVAVLVLFFKYRLGGNVKYDAKDDSVRLVCIDDGSEWMAAAIADLRGANFEYRLTVVPHLSSAVRALEEEPFDFVVFDPGLSLREGDDVFERIRTADPDTRLIAWSRANPKPLFLLIEEKLWSTAVKSKRIAEPDIRSVRNDRQRKLEAISAMERSTASERLTRLLDLGMHELGARDAFVTDIVGPDAKVVECRSRSGSVYVGLRCPSELTFCHHVLTSDEPIAIPDIDQSYLRDHPARELFSVGSYVACRVSGSPANQKSLCFLSETPLAENPSEDDLDFVRGLAFRVDVELKNQAHEIELSLTKSLFDAFMNNSPVVATLKDADGVFRYVNRISDPELGDWVRGFEGKSDRDVVDKYDYEIIRELDKRVLEFGETVQSRYPMDIPGQGLRYLHIIKFPVTSPELGPCVGTVSLDVTPQVEAKRQLAMAYEATLEGWTRTLDIRDSETQGHSRRVAELTVQLARRLGRLDDEIVHIWRGALLHDLGKIGIPDAVLNKSGPLTREEWEIMKRHPEIALNVLAAIPFLAPALDIPYCHHERWDGSGYPQGLRGSEIPMCARIFAVVDVYDALTSDRPYRKALKKEEVLVYIRGMSGVHFDPAIVEEFLGMISDESVPPQED